MSLVDALNESPCPMQRGPKCGIGKILAGADAKGRAALEASLADTELEGSELGRRLTRAGYLVKAGAVQRHRRGDCRCNG